MSSKSPHQLKNAYLGAFLVTLFSVWGAVADAATHYVAVSGNDGGAGTQAQPWKTIEYAVSHVNSGDRILVNNGTYYPTRTISFDDDNVSLIAVNPPTGSALNRNLACRVTINGANVSGGDPILAIYNDDNILIDGFEITNSSDRGINITGADATLRNCRVHENNQIGVFAFFATDLHLYGNEVYRNGLTGDQFSGHGIYLAKGCDGGLIERNWVHQNERTGMHINGNVPGGTPPFTSDGTNRNVVIRNNRIENNGGSGGDFFNIHDSFLINNLLINDDWYLCAHAKGQMNSENNVIANNTFVANNRSFALRLFGPNTGNDPLLAWANNNFVFNNIMICSNGANAIVDDGNNNQLSHNITMTYSQGALGNLFENAQGGNYQITNGSNAHDGGVSSVQGRSAPSTDLNDRSRPMGNAFDIGAYEFVEGVTNPQPPVPPQGLQASETTPGHIALGWQANSEPNITGYVVYYGPVSVQGGGATQYGDSVDVGDTTTWSQSGFSQGTWYFAVRAHNTFNESSGYSAEVSVDVVGGDDVAPALSGANPSDGAVNIPTDTEVFFVLGDVGAGVDTNSVSVLVNGTPPADVFFFGDPSSYAVVCEPGTALPPGSLIQVSVTAEDMASPPNTLNASWSFTTAGPIADIVAPAISGRLPANGALGVSLDTEILFVLSDAGSGVDTNSVSVLIDGIAPAGTAFYGVPSSYAVVCTPAIPLPASATISVSVTASDRAASPNTVNASWSFTTEDTATTTPDVSPPVVSGGNPANGAIDVSRDTDLFFVLSDAESGVDTNSVSVLVNGMSPARTMFYGNASSYAVVCQLAGQLPVNTVVSVGVAASDRAASPNMVSANWSFTTEDTAATAPDVVAPVVSGVNPANGAIDVARDTDVFFVLSDAGSGVDTNSVSVLIDGAAPARTVFFGVPSSYAVVCELVSPLPANATVSVGVTASDRAVLPNTVNTSWSFTTEDTATAAPDVTPPVVSGTNPADGAVNVARDGDVFFVLSDAGSGVDTSSVSVLIDGMAPAKTVFYGVPSSYAVVCELVSPLPASASISVAVAASDLAASPNTVNPNWSFTTEDTATAAPDVTAPALSGVNPADGSVDVSRDTDVFFVLSDAGSGVDTNSVSVLIDGLAPAKTVFYGVPSSYGVVCELVSPLPANANISVAVTASDLAASPNTLNTNWSFTTQDTVAVPSDVTAPVLSGANPADGAVDVPRDTDVFFVLSDPGSGVDTNSVAVLIDGIAPAKTVFYGVSSSYAVVCDLASPLAPNTTVAVSVTAWDLAASPNQIAAAWSFTTSQLVADTTDTASPVFYGQDPPPNADAVRPDSDIIVRVRDDTAVDPLSVELYYNGTPMPVTITIADTLFQRATVVWENTGGLTPGSTAEVRIVACDRSGNCATQDYSFEVLGTSSAPITTAAIVPDGYWVDDPNRPLEVRNLPLNWTVRIFNPAGVLVRAFENRAGSSTDWAWDFRNDAGMRVAKSLYLVRVVDENGAVQQAGRFVVQ